MSSLSQTGVRPAPHRIAYDLAMALSILALGGLLAIIGFTSRRTVSGPVHRWSLDRSVDTLVGTAALWAGSAIVIWWAFSLTVAFAGAALIALGKLAPAERLGRLSPAFMQRLALAVLGLNLVLVPTAQASTAQASKAVVQAPVVSTGMAGQAYDPSFPGRHPTDLTVPDGLDPAWSAPPFPDAKAAAPGPDLDPGWTPGPSPAAGPGLLNHAPRMDTVVRGGRGSGGPAWRQSVVDRQAASRGPRHGGRSGPGMAALVPAEPGAYRP